MVSLNRLWHFSLCLFVILGYFFAAQATLPTSQKMNSFNGKSSWMSSLDADYMSMMIKEGEALGTYYILLAEYAVYPLLSYTTVGEKIDSFLKDIVTPNSQQIGLIQGHGIVHWINRLHIYLAVQDYGTTQKPLDPHKNYKLYPLKLKNGALAADFSAQASILRLSQPGQIVGSTLVHNPVPFKGQKSIQEVIQFTGRGGSTWEYDFVDGQYYGTRASSGRDYLPPFNKRVNTEIRIEDNKYIADFKAKNIGVMGQYTMARQSADIYLFSPLLHQGSVDLTQRLGVFVDIMDWKHHNKPKFTTRELLLINPKNPADVGFFYERHNR